MLVRLQGLVIIVNTLIPAILLVSIVGAFLYWKDTVAARWAVVEPQLEEIRNTADASLLLVQGTAGRVTERLSKAANGLDAVAVKFKAASATVEPTLLAIERVTVPGVEVGKVRRVICGVERIKKGKPVYKQCWPYVKRVQTPLGTAVAKPFRDVYTAMGVAAQPLKDMKAVLGEIGVLEALPEKAEAAQAAISVAVAELLKLAGPVAVVLQVLGYTALFLLIWYGLQYGVLALGRIATGWRMLVSG